MLKKSWKKSYNWVVGRWTPSSTTLSPSSLLSPTQLPEHSPYATMICIKPEESNNKNKKKKKNITKAIPKSLRHFGRRTLVKDMVLKESPNSQDSSSKHVVIVMDALEEFSIEPLQWALDHVIATDYAVTLLGIMPWLNLPLSCKTWLGVWTVDLEDLPALRERSDWTTDIKYQKVRAIIELCDKYGVVPNMKVAMGYPTRLLVLEQTTSLHATWVVFDRHHRKNRAFYAKRIPCNVVMMNSEGEMDILKTRSMINKGNTTPGESPASLPLVPKVIISEKLMGILKPIKEQSHEDEDNSNT